MGNSNGNFKVWPLMIDELAPPEPPQKRTAIEDDTIISYGEGEYTFGLTLAQQEDNLDDQNTLDEHFNKYLREKNEP